MRLTPHGLLPRQYGYLGRHAAKSFITYYTYNHADAAFTKVITVPHGMTAAPLHDMWVAKQVSTTGDATVDFPTNIEGIMHGNVRQHALPPVFQLTDAYTCTTDATNVYIQVRHQLATTGTYHVYFHIKLYLDGFEAKLFDGERTSTTLP